MSTARRKKKIRRRQKGPLQRSGGQQDVTRGTAASRARSATAGSGSSSSSGDGAGGRRGATPGALTRSQGSRNLAPGRPAARRARADARADVNPVSPRVSKPAALRRQNAKRDLNPTNSKQVSRGRKPKRDFATGRTLFPVEGDGGKIQYLPMASEASALEVKNGSFVADAAVRQAPANKLLDSASVKRPSVRDFATVRTLFATETAGGKREYLPKQSEATALELSQGKYVPDQQVEGLPRNNQLLDKPPLRDFAKGRTVFATAAADGRTDYLPRKSEATALELSQGRYVDDEDISAQAPLGEATAMSNRPPRYDLGKGRKVYAVKTPAGETVYLPRQGEASGLELARGLFIPDDVAAAHESKRRRTALRDDGAAVALRRWQRAARLPAGVRLWREAAPAVPVREAEDGTVLWDGFTPPEVSQEKQRQTLERLRPKYDIGKGRMLYPTETAQGKVEYLPLRRDAREEERFLGLYAAFAPLEPLAEFLGEAETQGEIARRSFGTEGGEIRAFAQEDIEKVFERATTLVLRSAQMVSDSAREMLDLQQQFSTL